MTLISKLDRKLYDVQNCLRDSHDWLDDKLGKEGIRRLKIMAITSAVTASLWFGGGAGGPSEAYFNEGAVRKTAHNENRIYQPVQDIREGEK